MEKFSPLYYIDASDYVKCRFHEDKGKFAKSRFVLEINVEKGNYLGSYEAVYVEFCRTMSAIVAGMVGKNVPVRIMIIGERAY